VITKLIDFLFVVAILAVVMWGGYRRAPHPCYYFDGDTLAACLAHKR
jgi:hypothetical protein